MKKKKSWLVNQPIAHRGYHTDNADYPENSLKSFARAIQNGFAIELDVHILTDGEIAVFHDDNLQRMTGFEKAIEFCSSQEIKSLKLQNSEEKIPLLNEVLELVDGKVPLLIETKNRAGAGPLEKALYQTLIRYKGAYAIHSFNPFSLEWFRSNAPHIERGQISGSLAGEGLAFYKVFLLKYLLVDILSAPSFISYEIKSLPNCVLCRLRKKGMPILGWAAKSMAEYQEALQWCDNIIFEGFNPKDIMEPSSTALKNG